MAKRQNTFLGLPLMAVFSLSACGLHSNKLNQCDLPALSKEEVQRVAEAYLDTQPMNPEFMAIAEHRVTPVDCDYWYELAEELDTFGVAVVVVVDRRKKVVDFFDQY